MIYIRNDHAFYIQCHWIIRFGDIMKHLRTEKQYINIDLIFKTKEPNINL